MGIKDEKASRNITKKESRDQTPATFFLLLLPGFGVPVEASLLSPLSPLALPALASSAGYG